MEKGEASGKEGGFFLKLSIDFVFKRNEPCIVQVPKVNLKISITKVLKWILKVKLLLNFSEFRHSRHPCLKH